MGQDEGDQPLAHRGLARVGRKVRLQLLEQRGAGVVHGIDLRATFAASAAFLAGMGLRSLVLVSALGATLPLAASAAAPATDPPIGGRPGGLAILRPCATVQLKPRVWSETHAMLHRELVITLTNVGSTACAIDGFPAVRLLDALRHARIVAETFTGKPRQFIIAPNGTAAFQLRVASGDGTIEYMTAPTLAIIPPGDVAPLFLTIALPVAPTIEVSALQPATPLK
jgi:hypothetical protein